MTDIAFPAILNCCDVKTVYYSAPTESVKAKLSTFWLAFQICSYMLLMWFDIFPQSAKYTMSSSSHYFYYSLTLIIPCINGLKQMHLKKILSIQTDKQNHLFFLVLFDPDCNNKHPVSHEPCQHATQSYHTDRLTLITAVVTPLRGFSFRSFEIEPPQLFYLFIKHLNRLHNFPTHIQYPLYFYIYW